MRGEEKRAFDPKKFVISCAIGGAVGLAAAMLLLAGVAALTLSGMLERGSSLAYAAAAVGALVGGLIASKRSGAGALPSAAAAGAAMLLLCFIAGLIVFPEAGLDGALPTVIAIFAGSLAGGLLGAKPKSSRRKPKK